MTEKPWGLGPEFVGQFRAETDRACAVLGLAFLEVGLQRLFLARLTSNDHASLFESFGPLSTMAARTDLALALGWISPAENKELTLLRRVRNQFAHDFDHGLTFTTDRISDRCMQLWYPRLLLDKGAVYLSSEDQDILTKSARRRFELSVAILGWLIDVRIQRSTPAIEASEVGQW